MLRLTAPARFESARRSHQPQCSTTPIPKRVQEGALQGMIEYCLIRITFFFPVRNCKRNSHSHDKHEKWLNEIPEMQAMPFMVAEHPSKIRHDAAAFNRLDMLIESGAFTNEKEHGHPATEIDGRDAAC